MLLTKSNYLLGLQCLKLLCVSKNYSHRIPRLSDVERMRFREGELVGEFAKKLFPGGVDLSCDSFSDNLRRTRELLGKGVPLFEAGFLVDNFLKSDDPFVEVTEDVLEKIVKIKKT